MVSSSQSHSSMSNSVWLYYVSALLVRSTTHGGLVTFWNDLAQMWSTMRCCAEHMFDQGHFKVKVLGQTPYCLRSISFEPLVGFTKNWTHVKLDESMCSVYVWPRSGHGHSSRFNIVWLRRFTKFKKSDYHFNNLTPFPMLQGMGYSSLPVIALVFDPIFL